MDLIPRPVVVFFYILAVGLFVQKIDTITNFDVYIYWVIYYSLVFLGIFFIFKKRKFSNKNDKS